MPEGEDHFINARNYASDHLRRMKDRSPEIVRKIAEISASNEERTASLFGITTYVDVDRLEAELRHLFSIGVESATVLEDPTEHRPWLPSRRAEIQWRFWNRYMTYLERDFGMPPAVVSNLDDLTNMLLERLEDPRRKPPWDRRGMVVGSVQSGKTANYTGLICKAVDAGYKLIIVLAGLHSNLRAQTQLRLDEGVLGFDTQKSRKLNTDNRWMGVGKIPGERLVIHSMTSSAENGDFSKPVAETIGVMLGSDPVVLVIKKNSSLLTNLIKWITSVAGSDDPVSGKKIVRNVPLLLIDDEADNASINTKAKPGSTDGGSVTAINGKIRKLLDAFEKSAYVGYTATPFANIFINPDDETPEHGEDLFPRSFIMNVKPPTNYVGPGRVFGIDGDPDAGIPSGDGLPIVREIDDFDISFPPKHHPDHLPTHLPESLKRAIRCFILTCAGRRARGQDKKHNSMLVHVTRYVAVQESVVRLIRDELAGLRRRIEFGDGNRKPALFDELKLLWEEEFAPVSRALGSEAGSPVRWGDVKAQLHLAAAKITVLPINGYAKEVLDYKEHEAEGRSVIAVGGDKLSRGLTLEGLSISYFLRTSRMYDTLMQMGRWFGYRPGYLDLCRLFTTRTLRNWYRHIAFAEEELRREFDYMVAAGLTPEKYGLRVRTHPDGMIVTALNKMSHGRTLNVSWTGVLAQTTQLPKESKKIESNLRATETLVAGLGDPSFGEGHETCVWCNVPAAVVAKFVGSLQFPPASARASGEQLAAFIQKQVGKIPPELTSWTVAVVSNARASGDQLRVIAGHEIGLIVRNPEGQDEKSIALKKANILNPADEGWDFKVGTDGRKPIFDYPWLQAIVGKTELAEDEDWLADQVGQEAETVALNLTRRWQEGDKPKIRKPPTGETQRANGRVLRVLRRAENGLLLIYPVVQPVDVKEDLTQTSEPTGLSPAGQPLIGVALSFPTSETTLGVEYRVNTIWGAEMQEDANYED
jgi:hypothetical protein